MRGLAVLAAAVAAAISWGTHAGAADIRIRGFVFGCQLPSGERLKPKFGDVGGAVFTGLLEKREACLRTIDGMVYSCRECEVLRLQKALLLLPAASQFHPRREP